MWLFRLSLRNLLRQKRRSVLLGSAMAIGVALLVLANSFSNGLTDIMMNKILRWVTGHVTVSFYERGRMMSPVFRDKHLLDFIGREYKDILTENSEAIGQMVRAVGNGKADNIILIGLDTSQEMTDTARKEMEEQFRLVEGDWKNLDDTRYENPVIITTDKARFLNLKMYDTVRLRLRNVYGQDQSARVTLVGTMKIANIFMGSLMFGNVRQVKAILGYDEHSTGSINLLVKEPEKNARKLADGIHRRLQESRLAAIVGAAEFNGRRASALVLGFNSNSITAQKLAAQLNVVDEVLTRARLAKAALVAQPLARRLGVRPGDAFEVRYQDKWGAPTGALTVRVGGIFQPGTVWDPQTVLLEDVRFYEAFYGHWPRAVTPEDGVVVPGKDHPAWSFLSPEWILLPRTATTADLQKKMTDMGKKKWHSTMIDVGTMYETAEQILKLQGVMNLITLAAVLVLFFIILIGVINTLRMTMREGRREIGTVRAIGMQRRDVLYMFVLETLLLAFFAALAGGVLALLTMGALSQIPMNLEDNPMGMFLVNSRLYFAPTAGGVVGNVLLILILAGVTAYFPARRAARLAPGAALRHVE